MHRGAYHPLEETGLQVMDDRDSSLRCAEKHRHGADAGKKEVKIGEPSVRRTECEAVEEETKNQHPEERLHEGEGERDRPANRLQIASQHGLPHDVKTGHRRSLLFAPRPRSPDASSPFPASQK